MPERVRARLDGGLIPAVPVPFRGTVLAVDAQRAYAAWMAGQDVAGHEADDGFIGVERKGAAGEQCCPEESRDQKHEAGGEPEG